MKEKVKKNCPKCGKPARITNYDEKLNVLTKHGWIEIKYDYYFCRYCHKGFTLIDNEIGLLGEHKITLEMTDLITYAGQVAMSFEKSSEMIEKFTEIKVSESLIRLITEETGEKVFEQERKRVKESYEKPEKAAPALLERYRKEGILYIFTDGSQVNTIFKDEKGSTWREMKLGLVFYDGDSIRRKDGKMIITKKEYVTFFGGVDEFKKLLFDAAARAGYGKIRQVVFIGDGSHWIWSMCNELFPDAVHILDYYHLSENVHAFARYLYPDNEVKMKGWANDILDKIDEGLVDEVLRSLPDLKDVKLPAQVPNLKTYIENNRGRVDYRRYRLRGYYIGSGAIESGNKLVVQQRMKQSGMRWSISGGQYIASLRAKYASNQWNKVREVIGL
ncbi:MAG: ISKra4 family transposase [Thermoanaerobacteraceae bacterium]|nr:ISKra4 family transposase [Thermoanaerobacteraceae bacterium]